MYLYDTFLVPSYPVSNIYPSPITRETNHNITKYTEKNAPTEVYDTKYMRYEEEKLQNTLPTISFDQVLNSKLWKLSPIPISKVGSI